MSQLFHILLMCCQSPSTKILSLLTKNRDKVINQMNRVQI